MDCIFCKIINGELPSKKIYEDELVSGSFKLLTIYGLYNVPPLIAALTAVIC